MDLKGDNHNIQHAIRLVCVETPFKHNFKRDHNWWTKKNGKIKQPNYYHIIK